jgi:hypothetical protein
MGAAFYKDKLIKMTEFIKELTIEKTRQWAIKGEIDIV